MQNQNITFTNLDEWLEANPLYQWRNTSAQTLPAPVDTDPVKPAVPQEDVAVEIGSTRMAVSYWENGKFLPKYEYFIRLAKLIQYESADKLYDDWLKWRDARPATTEVQPVAA